MITFVLLKKTFSNKEGRAAEYKTTRHKAMEKIFKNPCGFFEKNIFRYDLGDHLLLLFFLFVQEVRQRYTNIRPNIEISPTSCAPYIYLKNNDEDKHFDLIL